MAAPRAVQLVPRLQRQSEIVAPTPSFAPRRSWSRLSFLDLVDGEVGYVDGETRVACWPVDDRGRLHLRSAGDVVVARWAPCAAALQQLASIAADWPPVGHDVEVRDVHGRAEVRPCARSLLAAARRCTSTLAIDVVGEVEAQARRFSWTP